MEQKTKNPRNAGRKPKFKAVAINTGFRADPELVEPLRELGIEVTAVIDAGFRITALAEIQSAGKPDGVKQLLVAINALGNAIMPLQGIEEYGELTPLQKKALDALNECWDKLNEVLVSD